MYAPDHRSLAVGLCLARVPRRHTAQRSPPNDTTEQNRQLAATAAPSGGVAECTNGLLLRWRRRVRIPRWAAAFLGLALLHVVADGLGRPLPSWQPYDTAAGVPLAGRGTTAGIATEATPYGGTMKLKFRIVRFERRGRYFQRRTQYDAKTDASYQPCRLLLVSGDIELNPGPAAEEDGARSNKLTVYHANTRSLKKQLSTLRAVAPALQQHDVVSFSETWMNNNIADSELEYSFSEHTWFRRDCDSLGGGVACAVRSSLQPLRLPDPVNSETLLIRLQRLAITVAVCYRPPGNITALDNIATAVSTIKPADSKLIVIGDFNLADIRWTATSRGAEADTRTANARTTRFLDSCDELGLRQWMADPTRGNNTLDLVFSRRLPATVHARDSLFDTDHRELVAEFVVPGNRTALVTRTTALDYKRADFPGLRRSLLLAPWSVLDGVDVDEAVERFYDILHAAIADHIPTVTLRRQLPPWFDREVRAALRRKEAAYRRLRRTPGPDSKADFSEKRRLFKTISTHRYYQYLRKLTDDFHSNSKRYWSFLKCVTKKTSISPVLCDANHRTVTDDRERATLLNEAFSAKFSDPHVNQLPHTPSYNLDNMSSLYVSEDLVRSALLSINPNKACGTDNVSARVIAECAQELVTPLTKICAVSVRSGVFPERWKQANIIPIFKKGDKKQANNYRSVSLLSLFGKTLERVVYDQLYRHVSPVLCAEQHGFIPRRSCVTNLATYLRHAWEAISDGYQTDTIYTDYSAAFQSVKHALIIHKLQKSFHLQGTALKWFVSYLSDRRQRVIVNGKTSDWKPVASGVPEGAILASLIFSMYINDLPQHIQSHCLMYADDVKIFRKIQSPSDGKLLQDDLASLERWSVRWGLKLNPQKCRSFSMTLRRAPVRTSYSIAMTTLEHVEEIRDLGVTLDTKLTFAAHISDVVKRANRSLGMLIRSFQAGRSSRSNFKTTALLAAYFANVRSILEYASVVWAGAADTHTARVDRVQHKFLMWLSHHSSPTSRTAPSLSYPDLSRHFKIPSLASRRIQHDLIFLKNILTTKLDCPFLLESFSLLVPARLTRSRHLLYEPRARVNTVQRGMFCRLPKHANCFLNSPETRADMYNDSLGSYRGHVVRYVARLHVF